MCAGNKGAQGSQDLHLPPLREAEYPHHSHTERDVLICHFADDKIRLNFATAPILLTVVCVSPLIKLVQETNLSAEDCSKKSGS